jgi:hypothetical protein
MIIVADRAARIAEQLGSRDKYWFIGDDDITPCLFKLGRPDTGEHWAEVVVSRIAQSLEIPHARYDLASDGRIGVVTPSIVTQNDAIRLIHGNEILARTFRSYPEHVGKPRASYNLYDIHEALRQYSGIQEPDASTDFGTYLLLDALVANQDRHHENWGILEMPDGTRVLAPTFDHAASLACRLTETERVGRLATRDRGYTIEAFATKARTWFYREPNGAQRLSTIEAVAEWLPWMTDQVVKNTIDRLSSLDRTTWVRMFDNLTGTNITDIEIEFTVRLLQANQSRLTEIVKNVVE